MFADIRAQLQDLIKESLKIFDGITPPGILIDVPADKQHGEFSCNVALQLSRLLRKNPLALAEQLLPRLQELLKTKPVGVKIARIEVKAPGFINFYLTPQGFCGVLYDIFAQKENYGHCGFGENKKFCLEFVSANPTGPLTVAHGRQAAVGDVLVNILQAVGFSAKREYYVNDEGNQINILGRSIQARARQALGQEVDFPQDAYQGEYIRTMAGEFMRRHHIKTLGDLDKQPDAAFRQFGVSYLMDVIKKDLEDFGVHFDIWSYQSKIAHVKAIEALLSEFRKKEFVYDGEGALWFKSTQWGDDKDRVVRKSDGQYTYLTPDIVYHKDKFARGFVRIVNILGPDHHGYIPRIKAAAAALGHSVDDLDILIVQLATIYRNGKEVSMSTRRGEFISLREVMDEVGRDAARFFFLMRQASAHLEFDLELAKKQSPENPVYYIQYAHARIHSIIRKAHEEQRLSPKTRDMKCLKQPEEIDLMRKLGLLPDILIGCARTLEPFSLVRYLQEVAAAFHKFYDTCRVLDEDKELSSERLGLIGAVQVVLANGLKLLGVSAPEKM
ncbi:MAG: arginine--tRNA ligase [Candidatus Omnitrophica bacterium]|nr:arginine--tRNA ligase [Candidatus Omnitrophota bacterium]MDE2214326.1 arginine--tRNA ligase [Candidatus Omnitrophota bacterium]MDE2231075.1 arginine--tRNA ligase [Candidatus Omnitrophota bacterium]